jgi:transposase-like protein
MPTVTEQQPESARRRGRYPKEFRRDATSLVIDQHRTIADVARELGVVEQTLGNWVRQERIDRGEREGTTTEIREGERQAAPGGQAPDHRAGPVEKSNGLLGEGVGPVSRYRWIDARKAEHFPVAVAAGVAGVCVSSYYDWLSRSAGPTEADWDEAMLVNEMHEIPTATTTPTARPA